MAGVSLVAAGCGLVAGDADDGWAAGAAAGVCGVAAGAVCVVADRKSVV